MLYATHPLKMKDCIWLWGHHPGVHDIYELPKPSTISPQDAAKFMGIYNLMMIRFDKWPESPYDSLAASLSPLKRVVWSLVGAGGRTSKIERDEVLGLHKKHNNIKGFMLDDFWSGGPESNNRVILKVDELKEIHDYTSKNKLDIWSVCYISELFNKEKIKPYFDYIDRFTLWSWVPEHLNKLDEKLEMFKDIAPNKPRYLGCYLWDYGRKTYMPLDIIQKQCFRSLELIQQKELSGIIFLGSPVCDVGLESVSWVRNWIASISEVPVPK